MRPDARRSYRERRLCAAGAFAMALASMAWCRHAAAAAVEDLWLRDLQQDVRADIAAGRPVVVQVHVPLCDNAIIRCGGRGLGDGGDLDRNLYWATSEGLRGWMGRRGSGWTLEATATGASVGEPDVLEVRVWRRELPLPRAWSVPAPAPAPGPALPRTFTVRLVGFAWRGTAIDRALSAYLADLYRPAARVVPLPGGGTVDAGGAARLVAWVGHNRLMDVDADWNGLRRTADESFRKGTLAIACYSARYLRPALPAPGRVPLLFTASFVMASSAAMEAGAMAFLTGGDLAAVRAAGAAGYAAGQRRPVGEVRAGFINPSDRRW